MSELQISRPAARWRAFSALCHARFREFYRESEVVFWSFIFPILLSVGLGLAFRSRPPEVLPVAVVRSPGSDAWLYSLKKAPLVDVRELDEAEAAQALRMGRVALVVVPAGAAVSYRFDPARPDSVLARARVDDAFQRAAGREDPVTSRDQEVSEPGARYIDFLIPGILGMNLLSGGMWGMGFNLVDMRMKKLLKRLLATPMRRSDFMLAQMTTRLAFTFVETVFLLSFGRLAFGMPVRGSWISILVIAALGALCFAGMGLLAASRARRIEGVMGIMNAVMVPMFVCSGVFFSWERFPPFLQPLIRLLPLTALNDALRAVILEGVSFASQAGPVSVIVVWGVVSFALGLRLFRWN